MIEPKFNTGSHYCKGGEKMSVLRLNEVDVNSQDKDRQSWLQMFNCGYRVTRENVDWNMWNGCVFVDIDSKHYYNEVKKFDTDGLFNGLDYWLSTEFQDYYFNIQKSHSGTSYHIMFYFNVERTELNFKKCVNYAREIIRSTFSTLGIEDIINYNGVLDKCCVSAFQGMYLSSNPIKYNDSIENNQWFGKFDEIDEYEIEDAYETKTTITKNSKATYKLASCVDECEIKDWSHNTRWQIMNFIAHYFDGDKEKSLECYKTIIPTILKHISNHTEKELLDHFVNQFDRFNTQNYYTSDRILEFCRKNFGFKFNVKKEFEPRQIDMYKADYTVNLKDDETLSDCIEDILVKSKKQFIHLFASCGLGKTYMSKTISNDDIDFVDWAFGKRSKRVCFITPMTSIGKDSFEGVDNWVLIDGIHKLENKIALGSVKDILKKREINVCTTWESFAEYEMWNKNFDIFILDEAHTMYMYDYRVKSVKNLKDALRKVPSQNKVILMTGTPSYEVQEFDCFKVEVKKNVKEVNCEVVFYNKQYRGYVFNDIKEWISNDETHQAIVFYDRTNYKFAESLKYYGLTADLIYNKQYDEDIEYVNTNKDIKGQLALFSVYGQAGINIIPKDTNKRIRIYVLNKNGLGIVQYANRVRNKEMIDKVVIPFKVSEVSNNVKQFNDKIDFEDGRKRVEYINKTYPANRDIFTITDLYMFKSFYKLVRDVLDKIDNTYLLNDENFKVWKLIEASNDYERQIQVIYNRLLQANLKASFNYLEKDVPDKRASKHHAGAFSGQMIDFNFDIVSETNDGQVYLDLDNDKKLKQIMVGSTKEDIEYILNDYYRNSNKNFEEMQERFMNLIQSLVSENDTIKKVDLSQYRRYLTILSNLHRYIDAAFLLAMLNDDWTVGKLTAAYVRNMYQEGVDWYTFADDCWVEIKELKKIVDKYKQTFVDYEWSEDCRLSIQNDDITQKIYNYVIDKHSKGGNRHKGSKVVIDGFEYESVKKASELLGKNERWVYRHIDK